MKKLPKIGTIVKVRWFDAFTYTEVSIEELESGRWDKCVHESYGVWFGTYKAKLGNSEVEHVDIRYNCADITKEQAWDGIRIPTEWIINIEEYNK